MSAFAHPWCKYQFAVIILNMAVGVAILDFMAILADLVRSGIFYPFDECDAYGNCEYVTMLLVFFLLGTSITNIAATAREMVSLGVTCKARRMLQETPPRVITGQGAEMGFLAVMRYRGMMNCFTHGQFHCARLEIDSQSVISRSHFDSKKFDIVHFFCTSDCTWLVYFLGNYEGMQCSSWDSHFFFQILRAVTSDWWGMKRRR